MMKEVGLGDVEKISTYIGSQVELDDIRSIMSVIILSEKEDNNKSITKRELINRTIDCVRKRSYSNSFAGRFEHESVDEHDERCGIAMHENLLHYDDYSEMEMDNLLSKIPLDDQKILTMYIFDDMTHAQIARRMGIERSSVTKRMKEILTNVKHIMEN